MTNNQKNTDLHRVRALLNGLIIAIVGFGFYVVPGWSYARQLGSQLQARNYPAEEISRQVKTAVLMFYQANPVFNIMAIAVITVLVLWRAVALARGTGRLAITHGLLVAAVPVLAALGIFLSQATTATAISASLIFAITGLVGGRWGQSLRP